ncbi:hypothetical protein B0T20DRAFT_462705 [Sordaria brevicollis]|uniref:BZIP domain-containing protein n=1 Tax=Sordaria brevicollis TaxID=83679 RepID=A0AAE0U9T2_SORBR|nr:hypothetical protein B0T20DRAFT_462705 [Sordaria brevicollis]
MDSWAAHSPSPANLKFENPSESLLATPGEMFPEVFGSNRATSVTPSIDVMSPVSLADDVHTDLTALATLTVPQIPPRSTPASTPAPETEKKPVKKRKSWGQVLPEPKTNLPPRKRAKTEDEKEQRRVERVLRNRRAAQSSRERKRLEVEGLERRNKELETLLIQAQQINQTLLQALRENGVAPTIATRPTSFDGLNPTPVTFSQELFTSQDGHDLSKHDASLDQLFPTIKTEETVNPASLSPAMTPIPEMEEEENEQSTAAQPVADATSTLAVNTSPDATQHPAVVLCDDLPCRSAEVPRSKCLVASQQSQTPLLDPLSLLLLSASTISWMASFFQRPLMLIATSMKRNFSLPPAPAILMTIVWLVTTPKPSTSRQTPRTSSTNSSTPRSQMSQTVTSSSRSNNPTSAPPRTRHSPTLRIRTLRKILTSSPSLARPLMDATLEVLRWVASEGRTVPQVSGADKLVAATADGKEQRAQPSTGLLAFWPKGAMLPSKEVLLTLVWVLRVEERKMRVRAQLRGSSSKLGGSTGVPSTMSQTPIPTHNNKLQQQYKLKVIPRRKWKAGPCGAPQTHLDTERRRMS